MPAEPREVVDPAELFKEIRKIEKNDVLTRLLVKSLSRHTGGGNCVRSSGV